VSEANPKKSQELSRWLVALVLIPPTLAVIFLTNKLFLLALTMVLGTLAWKEFSFNLLGRERRGLFILALTGFYCTILGASFFGADGQSAGLAASLILGGAYLMRVLAEENDKVSVNLLSRYCLGQIYLSFFLSFIMLIKQLDHGANWLFFIVLVTSLNDTAAFYVGSRLGGPKLYPKISPNKTISGFMGGCLVSFIVGGLSANFLPLQFNWFYLALLGLFLGVWGTFGDLFESSIKRAMGIKDTSNILKGHGGVWDRLDSLLFNLAPVYYFVNWLTQP
jgi:phosphatidate cytidylyltransferase